MQVFTGLSESTVLLPLFVVASARRPPTLINFEMLRSTELVCLTVHKIIACASKPTSEVAQKCAAVTAPGRSRFSHVV